MKPIHALIALLIISCLFAIPALAAAPVADFTGTPTALLLGNSTTFTDSSTNTPTSWLWDFGDGNHAITQNPVYLWNITGIYTVNLTASNDGGSDKKTRIDYVNVSHPLPAPTPTPTPIPGGVYGVSNINDLSMQDDLVLGPAIIGGIIGGIVGGLVVAGRKR